MKGKDDIQERKVNGILKKWSSRCFQTTQNGVSAGSCKNCNVPSLSIKSRIFLPLFRNCRLLS